MFINPLSSSLVFLVGMQRYLIMVIICISLMTDEIEHLFIYL